MVSRLASIIHQVTVDRVLGGSFIFCAASVFFSTFCDVYASTPFSCAISELIPQYHLLSTNNNSFIVLN
jgi:hypothetical protein